MQDKTAEDEAINSADVFRGLSGGAARADKPSLGDRSAYVTPFLSIQMPGWPTPPNSDPQLPKIIQ